MAKNKLFKSRPDAIQKMLTVAIDHLPQAASTFRELVAADPSERPAIRDKLCAIESEADEAYVTLIRKVVATFITPFDREDLYNMVETLDDIIDGLEQTGCLLTELDDLNLEPQLLINAELIEHMAIRAHDAVGHIKKPNKFEKDLTAVNRFENELDDAHRQLLVEALALETPTVQAQRTIRLADQMEAIASGIERFTRSLAVAAVKET